MDAVITEYEARKAREAECGPELHWTNTHVGSDLDVCTFLGDLLADLSEVGKTVDSDVACVGEMEIAEIASDFAKSILNT